MELEFAMPQCVLYQLIWVTNDCTMLNNLSRRCVLPEQQCLAAATRDTVYDLNSWWTVA
jgi:hypothetical protein